MTQHVVWLYLFPELPVYTTKEPNPVITNVYIDEDTKNKFRFKNGWAHPPTYGKKLGNNTVNRFKFELKEFFDAGQLDKGRQMSASRMRDALELRYPNCYDIPSDQAVIYYICSFVRNYNNSIRNQAADGRTTSVTRLPRISGHVSQALRNLHFSDSDLMPRHGWTRMLESLGLHEGNLPEGFPSGARFVQKCLH